MSSDAAGRSWWRRAAARCKAITQKVMVVLAAGCFIAGFLFLHLAGAHKEADELQEALEALSDMHRLEEKKRARQAAHPTEPQ